MHPVILTEDDVILMKQAKRSGDWHILPTHKLRYLYQRLVSFPAGDIATVKEIAEEARKR